MSANLKYRAFLITVAARGGVPLPIASNIVDVFNAKCDELDYGIETTLQNEPHLHMLCLMDRSSERGNVKQVITRIVTKYICISDVKKGIDVRVVNNAQVVIDYISKQTELNHEFPLLREYVDKNFSKADEIIKKNLDYKNNQIKYAYDNYTTWSSELNWKLSGPELWAQYRSLIAVHEGKSPSTRWKLEFVFENMCFRKGYISEEKLISDCPKFLRE